MDPIAISEFENDIRKTMESLLCGSEKANVEFNELRMALELLVRSVVAKYQQKTRDQFLKEEMMIAIDQVAERMGLSREEVLARIEIGHIVYSPHAWWVKE